MNDVTINDIVDMWGQDSGTVNETRYAEASAETAKLHSKYLRYLVQFKMARTKVQSDHDILRRFKFRYYRGELTRKELETLGWEQWQYAKPLKGEMEELVRGDADIRKFVARIEEADTAVEALEEILKQIKQRDFAIGNAIRWKIFLAGG